MPFFVPCQLKAWHQWYWQRSIVGTCVLKLQLGWKEYPVERCPSTFLSIPTHPQESHWLLFPGSSLLPPGTHPCSDKYHVSRIVEDYNVSVTSCLQGLQQSVGVGGLPTSDSWSIHPHIGSRHQNEGDLDPSSPPLCAFTQETASAVVLRLRCLARSRVRNKVQKGARCPPPYEVKL